MLGFGRGPTFCSFCLSYPCSSDQNLEFRGSSLISETLKDLEDDVN